MSGRFLKTPKLKTRVCAAVDIPADEKHGVGAVPKGTQGTIVRTTLRASRDFGYVRVRWDNGAEFWCTEWSAL